MARRGPAGSIAQVPSARSLAEGSGLATLCDALCERWKDGDELRRCLKTSPGARRQHLDPGASLPTWRRLS